VPGNLPTVIGVHGARHNNLQNIDVDEPLWRTVAVVAVSGSGKTSLAIGTLYAEGMQRFMESLSTYRRRRLTLRSNRQTRVPRGHPRAATAARGRRASRSSQAGKPCLRYQMLPRLMSSRLNGQPASSTRLRLARNCTLALRIIDFIIGAIRRINPAGSSSTVFVTRQPPWPSGSML